MDWIGASTTTSLVIPANDTQANYIVLPSEVRDQFTDPTLVRTRGQLILSAGAAGITSGACGIIDWTDNNDTPPAAGEAPSPLIATFDWIWHTYFFTTGATQLASFYNDGGSGQSIDSKAMRRLGGRKGILFVISLLTGAITSVSYQFGVRCLLKD